MRATEFITELFAGGKDWKWSFTGSEEAVAVFHVGDIPYQFYAYRPDENLNQWDIEFKNASRGLDRGTKFGLTGTGNSAQVMSTIADILRAFLEKYEDRISELTFSAKEDSRQSLYAKMAKRLLPTWKLSQIGDRFSLTPTYTDLDEGWKDWVAGAAMGASALGGVSADAKPAQPVQPAKQEVSYNLLSNNPNNEITLLKTAKASGMKGTELAQFMAQTKHESWDFDRLKEKPQPGVKDYYNKKYDIRYSPKTAKILGNKHAGDGAKYHGRGFVQLTGRDNYRMAGQALGMDLLNKPELAARPDVAAKIAVWYWNTRVKPHINNFADTASVTKKINPAAKGLENRHENFKDYLRII